jgi:hypothetical protein
MIRIGGGLVTLYAMIACAFDLQNFVGEDGWVDVDTVLRVVRETPYVRYSLRGNESPLPPPHTPEEKLYLEQYIKEFNEIPPGPYPRNEYEANYIYRFRTRFGYDLRFYGLPPPSGDDAQKQDEFLWQFATIMERPELRGGYSAFYNQPPVPPYPATAEEAKERLDYAAKYGVDPRRLLAKGQPVWSIFFHMTDPLEIRLLHAAVLLVTLLFTIGFCTRLTSALTWFAYLNYVHRMPAMLFGVDVMTNIVLIYMMIGPSGAALSVDQLIARWWSRNKLATVNRWRRLGGRSALTATEIRPAEYRAEPEPLVGANLAIRLLQVHLCIIYFVSGIAKLTGGSWWSGRAVWGTLANFEMAPMQFETYNILLRFISHNELVFHIFLLIGTYFTLVFEIGYAFLIWRPRLRRVYLAGALFLHGMIGVIMGLTSFSLIMLVMNMAFLTNKEAHLLLALPKRIWSWGVMRLQQLLKK